MDDKKRGRPFGTDGPKEKFTAYMPLEVAQMLNELYAYGLMTKNKKSRSELLCTGIKLLHKKTFNKLRNEKKDG